MERLTNRYDDGEAFCDKFSVVDDVGVDETILKGELIDKLAEYEDAEEQGLLLRLPCKVGDTVYSVTRDFISEYTICSIEMYKEGFFFNWRCEKGIYINLRGFTNFDFGETVFLTQEEAEQALEKMKEV